jgi:serine protease Do
MFILTRKFLTPIILVCTVAVVAVLGLTHSVALRAQAVTSPQRGLPDFTELVEQVGPSVVNIRTSAKVPVRRSAPDGQNGLGNMPNELQELFRQFGFPMPNMPNIPNGPKVPKVPHGSDGTTPPSEVERPLGAGSGFILSLDGYVMTNAHVVEGASDVVVTLTDKREFKAKVVGADKRTDVAVVKIEASGLPFVRIGNVERLKVGEWVMAIGSPFGLENSVTAGIVSAKARDTGEYLPFIQTDVAINPGNSGGPLINMRGEVVGINSQIVTRSGGYNGVSLAIPIDEAMRVADQLRAGGRVARGRIGVEAGSVSLELAESIGLAKPQGALVGRVVPDAPAAKAGIEPGDIILKFDGRLIDKSSDLPRAVGNTKPGSQTTVSVYRRGKTLELPIAVAEFEPEEAAAAKPDKPVKTEKPAIPIYPVAASFGLNLADLTEVQKKELKLSGGARIEAATQLAANSGLQAGDVIVAIANTAVSSAKEAESVLAKQPKNKAIALQVRRGDRGNFVLLKPE